MNFTATPKQAEFLESDADISLFSGSAGSGKTLAAVIQSLRLNEENGIPGFKNPKYNALICRKHYKDLKDIIEKTRSIYSLIDPGATYNKSELLWTFSSGAKIQITYFDTIERCQSMVQGAEYQNIFLDEAMHFDTDEIFLYLLSRLRNTFGMRNYMRLTSNPGPYPWIRNFFRIPDDGSSTFFWKKFELSDGSTFRKSVENIQSLLKDNPHIGKDYEAQLNLLSEADKNALLYGRWDAYDSTDDQVLEHELKEMLKDNRLCHLKFDPSVPVYTVWDIGMSDLTVILFVQFVGKEIRIIDMFKGSNKSLTDYYIPKIIKKGDDLGYNYACHYLPHDSSKRDYGNALPIFEQAKNVLRNVEQLPKNDLASGLQQMRSMCKNVWINKDLDLYYDLSKYKREFDSRLGMYKDKPVHDMYSHSADAFRYISYIEQKSPKLDIKKLTNYNRVSPFS